MNVAQLQWYWHRLRAMRPVEVAQHARRHCSRFVDERRSWDWGADRVGKGRVFPQLRRPDQAPESLRAELVRDADRIARGRWRAFGHLELQIDCPPRWHCDYLVGRDLATALPASRLQYRQLPAGADIKLIWELSRWTQLTRLAMAAYVLEDPPAARRCESWLWDWLEWNRPYRGWNWTSALEAGIRLIQLTWMDALLTERWADDVEAEAWGALMSRLLPAHVHFVWRQRSFGSSANNHLLGELTGLIVAIVRWPCLARWGVSVASLKALLEREILSQFASDGGNREQALNYHLFALEFGCQARLALRAAGEALSPAVEERLARAAHFFRNVQVGSEPWDYGDSDSAYVVPCSTREQRVSHEWLEWLDRNPPGTALSYWLGDPPGTTGPGPDGASGAAKPAGWQMFPRSGIGVYGHGDWLLRWDLSPLGYLRTAAHGHLDALHVSIWHRGKAIVIDPGTGAYYGDRELRAWLGSREAHNGPCPEGSHGPVRLGPFLWSGHHPVPTWRALDPPSAADLVAELQVRDGRVIRTLRRLAHPDGWEVADEYRRPRGAGGRFSVLWQFAPGTTATTLADRRFRLRRADAAVELELEVGDEWSELEWIAASDSDRGCDGQPGHSEGGGSDRAGWVSPAFRTVTRAPCLRLKGEAGDKPCVFVTRFLACSGT